MIKKNGIEPGNCLDFMQIPGERIEKKEILINLSDIGIITK